MVLFYLISDMCKNCYVRYPFTRVVVEHTEHVVVCMDGAVVQIASASMSFCVCLLDAVDSGLVVPSVTYDLHKRLLSVAERSGLTLDRRLEMTGVCASQMALTLLGGPNR